MGTRTTAKPRLAVVGLGDYFTKLRPGLSRYFQPVALIDSNPSAKNRLMDQEKLLFRLCRGPQDLAEAAESAALVMILTPNDRHVPYAIEAINAGKPTVIEKPIATSRSDLELLGRAVSLNAPLYCSDFYVDVRAIPMLAVAGQITAGDWRLGLVRNKTSGVSLPIEIGQVRRVEARIAENYPFRFGTWLGNMHAGGVTFDLMIHLFALMKRLLPTESLTLKSCTRMYANPEGPKSLFFAEPATPDSGEAFARLEGELTPSGALVSFEVLKGAHQTDRYFALMGSKANLVQLFKTEHPLQGSVGKQVVSLTLKGDRYELACRAIRKWFDNGSPSYGWEWNAWAVEQAIVAREWTSLAPSQRNATPTLHRHDEHLTVPEEHIDQGRRRFNWLAAIFVIGAIGETIGGAKHLRDWIAEGSQQRSNTETLDLKRAAEKTEPILNADRLGAIAGMVGVGNRLLLVPGSEYRGMKPLGTVAFPHDLCALAPFQHLGGRPFEVFEVEKFREHVVAGDIVVATGSPTSSQLARELTVVGSPVGIENLPYRLEEIEGEKFVSVVSGMLGGGWERKKGKRLIDSSSGEAAYTDQEHVGTTGRLLRDVLLVSRIPSGIDDCDIMLLSGGHGAGTQAIELLFDPRMISAEDMATLTRMLAGHRHWQFVIDITEIHHQEGYMSVAKSAMLSRLCLPKVFTPVLRRKEFIGSRSVRT